MSAVELSVGKLTHIGQVRSRNEDAMDLHAADGDHDTWLFIVADGMGGHSAGNVASQMAVESTLKRFFEDRNGDVADRLRRAIEDANRKIFDAAQSNSDYFRMGTTIVSAAIRGNLADIANVGDSRVYIVRDGEIQQVTRDHSWVALQVEMGELTMEEAQASQNRSVLLRCLGEKSDVLVDIMQITVRPKDIIVLCTDGLHGPVSAEEIRNAVTSADPQKSCDDLVALANARGGPDNITVQVVRIDACPEAPPDETRDVVIRRLPAGDGTSDGSSLALSEKQPVGFQDVGSTSPVQTSVLPASMPARDTLWVEKASQPSLSDDGAPSYSPSTSPNTPIPWLLIVFTLLAGAVAMALADRLFLRPSAPITTPEPPSAGGLSSPLAAANSDAGPGGPSGQTVSPGETPLPGATDDGRLVVNRTLRPSSLAAYRDALFWIEDSNVWSIAADGKGKAARLNVGGKANSVASSGSALFVATDDGVARLDVSRGVAEVKLAASSGIARATHVLAASETALYGFDDDGHKIWTMPTDGRVGASPLSGDAQDVVSIAAPPNGDDVFWAVEGKGIFKAGKGTLPAEDPLPPHPLISAPVSSLAANGTSLFWTEDSKDRDGSAQLRRSGLDGDGAVTVATLHGPVFALAASENAVYWVVSRPEGFSVRMLQVK